MLSALLPSLLSLIRERASTFLRKKGLHVAGVMTTPEPPGKGEMAERGLRDKDGGIKWYG